MSDSKNVWGSNTVPTGVEAAGYFLIEQLSSIYMTKMGQISITRPIVYQVSMITEHNIHVHVYR